MDFESKITSREISQLLWEREKTLGTAESCTGGKVAEAKLKGWLQLLQMPLALHGSLYACRHPASR